MNDVENRENILEKSPFLDVLSFISDKKCIIPCLIVFIVGIYPNIPILETRTPKILIDYIDWVSMLSFISGIIIAVHILHISFLPFLKLIKNKISDNKFVKNYNELSEDEINIIKKIKTNNGQLSFIDKNVGLLVEKEIIKLIKEPYTQGRSYSEIGVPIYADYNLSEKTFSFLVKGKIKYPE